MTNSPVSNQLAVLLALSAVLALAACSKPEGVQATAEEGESHEAVAPQSSETGLPEGNAAAGEKLAHAAGKATGQSCVSCHGEAGNAPIDPTYPKLGGQYADYIGHALLQYRSGERQHPLMSAQAAQLSDQDIADLGAYFGAQTTQLRDLHGLK